MPPCKRRKTKPRCSKRNTQCAAQSWKSAKTKSLAKSMRRKIFWPSMKPNAPSRSSIAEVIDISHLEVYGQVSETDRTNLKPGQPVDIEVGALPGETFTGKVQ